MSLEELTFIRASKPLKNHNGRSFGYIIMGDLQIFLDHWREGKKNYCQWKVLEKERKPRYFGVAVVNDEPINVRKLRRDKLLKEIIKNKFPDIPSETVEIFLSEMVEVANRLGSGLFPEGTTKEETEELEEISGFDDYDITIKEQANSILKSNPLEYFIGVLDLVHCGDVENKEILVLVLFTKHVMNGKPVNVIIIGSTESGKTSLANKTAMITPNRFLINTSSMSAKAAYYHQKAFREDFNHMIINDFLDSEEAIGTLKAVTDTEIVRPKHMTVSDDKKAVTLEIKGKNTVIVTAAKQLTDRELNRRLLHLNPDEDEAHELETKEFIVLDVVGTSLKHDDIFEVAQALYDKIIESNYEVFVPWILALDVKLLSKTDIKHFTNLVKARTLIHQSQRIEIMDKVLLSSLEDFQEVARLWKHISEMQTTYLPAKAFELLKLLPKWDKDLYKESLRSGDGHYGMKLAKISQALDISREALKRLIWGKDDQRGLVDLGYVHTEQTGDTKTSPWICYRTKDKTLYGEEKDVETSTVTYLPMFKPWNKTKDKKRVILSICNLFFSKGYLKKEKFEEIEEALLSKYDLNIETDEDIIKIIDFIKKNYIG